MRYLLVLLLLLTTESLHAQVRPSFAEECVERYAHHYGVPPAFIAALIDVESNWNPRAVSTTGPKGEIHALGIMQLLPSTATRFGARSPFDVEQNIAAGTRYVTTLMWEFHGDLRLVAAAYYAGDKWVGRRRLDYSNQDVITYVRKVRKRYAARQFSETTTRQEAFKP